MKTPKLLCTIAAVALAQGSLFAVNTDPVGFVSVTVPANSDAVLAVPLNRTSEFKGLTSALSGTSGSVTITVAGTPNWTAGQFAPLATANKTYALQLASGAKEGLVLPITNNGTNTVTVSASDNLTGVLASGEQIDIMPYWTPASLFPSTLAAGVQFFGFSAPPAGTNLAAIQIYSHTGSGVWENGDDFSDASNEPLPFTSAFVLRNGTASSQVLSFVGSVPMTSHRMTLATLAANKAQDIRFGYVSPVASTLAQAGLAGVGTPAVSGDQILVFNNSQSGINKSAAQILEFDGTDWTDGETFDVVTNTFQFTPGFGYLYRKFGTTSPTSVVWQDIQSYLQ